MRKAQPAEPERRLQLVMAGAERGGTVEHADPALLDVAQIPQPVLDAVERPPHVEAAEHDVAGASAPSRDTRLDEPCPHATLDECVRERLVRASAVRRLHTTG